MKKGRNHWEIIGNVGKTPEVRYTHSGLAVCTLSVAVNNSWKDSDGNVKEHVEWVNVVCWKKLAEIVGQYVKRGAPVFFEGRSQTTSYEHEGVKKYKTELVADNMILLGAKSDSSDPEEQNDNIPFDKKAATQEKEDLPF